MSNEVKVMYDDRLAGIISLDEYMKNANRIKEIIKGYEENIKDLEITNGYSSLIEKTNIAQVFPIVYKTNNLTIYEFPKEYTKKTYYVVEHNKSYKYEELVSYFTTPINVTNDIKIVFS